jgi:uncharacterized protein
VLSPRAPFRGCSRSSSCKESQAIVELLEYLARHLVDEPDAVRVDSEDTGDAVVFHLRVAPSDLGKVIGRQGRLARALRTIVRAGGARADRRYQLDIVE